MRCTFLVVLLLTFGIESPNMPISLGFKKSWFLQLWLGKMVLFECPLAMARIYGTCMKNRLLIDLEYQTWNIEWKVSKTNKSK